MPAGVHQLRFILDMYASGWAFGSDARITVTAPDGAMRTFDGGTDFGWATHGGSALYNGVIQFGPVNVAGTWTFEFWQNYFASPSSILYVPGSFILLCGPEADSCSPVVQPDPLDLDLSEPALTLTRGTAMTPVTATASGGSGNYAFSISPALPAGLSIDANTGTISGTPTVASPTTTYTVTVADQGAPVSGGGVAQNGADTATAQIDITVNNPPLGLTLSESSVMLTRTAAMTPVTATATGGSGSYAFSVSPALPDGLTIDEGTGTISGTPTTATPATAYTVAVMNAPEPEAMGGEETRPVLMATAILEITVENPPLGLTLSETAVTLTRETAMTPVTATATGGSGRYSFVVAPALPAGLMLDANTGTISGTPTTVSGLATYTVTVLDDGDVPATGPNGRMVSDTATINIEVVEDTARVAQAFTQTTGAFLLRRTERILSAEPRGWRLDQRRQAPGLRDLAMRADGESLALRFSAAHLSEGGIWHLWAEGEYSRYTDATGLLAARDGQFGMLSLGIDRLLNDRLALGLMLQADRTGEEIGAISDVSGNGWMVGPYLTAELRDGLFLAARLGWGRSSNDATLDVYQNGSPWFDGQFETTRSLARVALYGMHDLSNGLRILPEIDLAWIRDRQSAYTVTDGTSTVAVAGVAAERTRLTLAATLEQDLAGQEGRMRWFVRPSLYHDRESVGGTARDLTAGSLELGLRSAGTATWQGSASVRVDGLGQGGFDAWALRLDLGRSF
jgi:hypothetical protein